MTLMVQLEDAPVAAPEHTSRHRAPFLHPGSPAPALVEHGRVTTHDELARRVADLADRMPPAATGRRLVHLPLARDVAGVVGHLAVLAAGHVALVTGPDAESITERFAPDLRVADERIETLTQHAAHLLHPDSALLLSTSGSTGSPKLVRLSRHNLGEQRRGDRAGARAGPEGPRDHLPSPPLLLRAVGAAQHAPRRRQRRRDRPLGDRRRVLARAHRAAGHRPRGRPPHLRPHRVAAAWCPAGPAPGHPGGRRPRARPRHGAHRARAGEGVAARRHVRPDRGDRAHGDPCGRRGRAAPRRRGPGGVRVLLPGGPVRS
ncbi:hypothetical protein LP422_05060 [Janibacter limosus]|uniref:Uncharacterized protein n=1 Tax=Janibacter limosus TaxID=53458 RepID=A0AC61U625_9MICO|nr:hypothetical protein [Janibacter limosus]UUZ45489.1 hypothetical protein LP422_05060 [Janibacter limosus]